MHSGGKIMGACLLAGALALAGASWSVAQMGEPTTIKTVQERLDKLRIKYTEDYPEIIRLKEHLRKMKAMEAQKKAEERAKDPQQSRGISQDFKSSQSFE